MMVMSLITIVTVITIRVVTKIKTYGSCGKAISVLAKYRSRLLFLPHKSPSTEIACFPPFPYNILITKYFPNLNKNNVYNWIEISFYIFLKYGNIL